MYAFYDRFRTYPDGGFHRVRINHLSSMLLEYGNKKARQGKGKAINMSRGNPCDIFIAAKHPSARFWGRATRIHAIPQGEINGALYMRRRATVQD